MTEEEYWFWLCNIKYIYRNDINIMMKEFSCPEEIYKCSENEIRTRLKLNEQQIDAICNSKKNDKILFGLEKCRKNGISFIYNGHKDFPICFNVLEDPPFCIYVKGNLPSSEYPSVGMVGARACSGYGREFAGKYSKSLALSGIQIISGMALGIDSVSAKGAMEAGGRTFAVLGGGVDVIYPRENIELYYEIITSGGGIISEYAPGSAPLAWQFPHRNRLISAFSDKLIVIEAGLKSGTLSTAMHALDQGKDVYALPGRINDRLSEGCNRLIADGAGMLLDIEQFKSELLSMSKFQKCKYQNAAVAEISDKNIEGKYSVIYEKIGFEPIEFSRIVSGLDITVNEALEFLAQMELDGLIKHVSGDYYARS